MSNTPFARARTTVHRGPIRWRRGVGLVAALVVAFLLVAMIGAGEAQRGTRVLAGLDPVVAWIGRSGGGLSALALAHQKALGWAGSAAAAALALAGLIIGGRRGWPLLLLGAAVSLTVWGQIALLADQAVMGMCLYGAGFACGIGLGAWYPLTRLPGFPRWPVPGDRAERRAWSGWELALLFGLTGLALLSRVYALTELPNAFDAEMSITMLASHTFAGLRAYLPWGLLGNSTGLAHLLPQMAFFHLFGTSVYTLRLVAVLFGVAAVPLCYWLARRIAGTAPAVVATLLLITAPEQLFWSRSEDTHFAPIAVAALVTAHLGLWLTERVSVRAVLAAAVWMPFCRSFYAPAMVLFAFPVALYAHAVLFVRRAWRTAWYAVPLLAAGVVLWFFTLTIASAYVNHWQWRFVNPTGPYGAGAWTQQGQLEAQLQGPSLAPALRLRAQAVAANVGHVATAMAFRTGFTSFYARVDDLQHPTLINVGVLVMAVLGIGYLLGQVYERRAFALLAWVGLGLLPALLSNDPMDRRMSIIFPALYIIAGVFVGATGRLVRLCAGRVLERVTEAFLGVAVLAVAWMSLASHFLLPIGPLPAEAAFRFIKPLFEDSDIIFHNLEWNTALLMVFGNLDDFVARPPCYHYVAPAEWLSTAVQLGCELKDPVYRLTLPTERITELRAAPPRRARISFLLDDQPITRPQVAMLRALFPSARYSELRNANQELQLTALTIDHAEAGALHAPALLLGPDQPREVQLESRVLKDVTLAPSAEHVDAGLAVKGGLLIERPGWYRFALGPPCAQATLTVDERNTPALRPMLAGVHRFVLALPDPAACVLPVQLFMQSHTQPEMAAIPAEAIVSPAVAASGASAVQAPPTVTYDGYGEARQFVQPASPIVDFGVDAEGAVFVLLQEQGVYRVQRFSPQGTEEASWQPQRDQGYAINSMAVAPDGRVLLRGESMVWLFDRDGHRLSTWDHPPMGTRDIAILDDGRILSRQPDINVVAILDRDGRLQTQWDQFAGEPGRFRFPASVTRNELGDLLIIESDGHALLFHSPPGRFEPQFVRSFPIAFREPPVEPQGVAFDGRACILVPDADAKTTLVYNLDGERLMPAVPERDLNTRDFGSVLRYQATAEGLYVLDEQHRLWILAR